MLHGLVLSAVRDLHASADPRAPAAIDYFCYRIGQTLGATPSVWVIPTDEEAMIAHHILRVVRRQPRLGANHA